MTLLKTVSERLDNRGRPFIDYYLGWKHEGKIYLVRVKPQFFNNSSLLFATAVDVPQGECLEKYL